MNEIKVRQGVFETNSSSSHSISFNPWVPGKSGDNFSPDSNGIIHITGGDFGWGWYKYNDSVVKADYFYEEYHDDPGALEILREVIEDYTGHKVEFSEHTGYIDHQSVGTLSSEISPLNHASVKDFIFNPDVWLYIGDDNSEMPQGFTNDEIIGVSGGKHVTVTLEYTEEDGSNTRKQTVLPDFPKESNINQYLPTLETKTDYYVLESIDLEDMILVYESEWSKKRINVKIVKIESDELGEIV